MKLEDFLSWLKGGVGFGRSSGGPTIQKDPRSRHEEGTIDVTVVL